MSQQLTVSNELIGGFQVTLVGIALLAGHNASSIWAIFGGVGVAIGTALVVYFGIVR